MAAVTDVQVNEVILHILDPPGRGLVLSQRSLPATTDPRVFEYFRNHIASSLGSAQVRAAQFKDPEAPIEACKALFRRGAGLVDGSQSLARRLFAIMEANSRIARGDLAVCRYGAREDGAPVNQVALLKIDPTEAFRQTTQKDDQGRSYVDVEIQTEVLPTGDLQKCAFLRELEPRPADYDMILLDRQVSGDEVARFFSWSFLGAELVIDARQATKRLYEGLIEAENRLRPKLALEQLATFRQGVRTLFGQATVNLKRWMKSLPAEVREEVSASVPVAQLPDPIRLDQVFLARATRKVRYQGDFDLTLEVSENRFDELVTVTYKKPKVGHSYYEVVIKTQKWDKVK